MHVTVQGKLFEIDLQYCFVYWYYNNIILILIYVNVEFPFAI